MASRWRWEGWAQAKEAEVALGLAPPWVAPTEHDLRVFIHDVVEFGHDKDFRTFAGLPIHDLRAAAVFVLRVNGWGEAKLEVVLGPAYDPAKPLNVWTLIYKRHMCALRPPPLRREQPWWHVLPICRS